MPFGYKIFNNDIDALYFIYLAHLTCFVKYEFEDFAHYHDRTGKGHPDGALREIMQHKANRNAT
jgi:hypothetical protein